MHGDILVIDGSRFIEVRGYQPGRTEWSDPRTNGYTLYAGVYGDAAKSQASPSASAAKREVTAKRRNAKAQAKAKAAAGQKIAPSAKLWSSSIPLTGKAMALAGNVVFVAGTPLVFPQDDAGQGL